MGGQSFVLSILSPLTISLRGSTWTLYIRGCLNLVPRGLLDLPPLRGYSTKQTSWDRGPSRAGSQVALGTRLGDVWYFWVKSFFGSKDTDPVIWSFLVIWLLWFKQRRIRFKPIKRRLFCQSGGQEQLPKQWRPPQNSWDFPNLFYFRYNSIWQTVHSSVMTQITANLMEKTLQLFKSNNPCSGWFNKATLWPLLS